uniref:Uncharacterized protein n=1 Tax=Anguilla anguilla TaxID=7936 RepID=A0A0E9PVS7_ANGAN
MVYTNFMDSRSTFTQVSRTYT